MQRKVLQLIVAATVGSAAAQAGLKDALGSKLRHKDDTPAMVNLDLAKTKPVSRSSKAVVAVIWGNKIRKGTLDRYLKERSKGKVDDFDKLTKKQKLVLVREYYLPTYIAAKAKKAIPLNERKALYASAWLQDAVRKTEISEEELRRAYDQTVARARMQSALQQVPPFDAVKDRLKFQMAERQIVSQLMRGTEIREATGEKGVAGYVGKTPVSVNEADKAARKVTRGQKGWSDLNANERMQLLHMIAPQKVIAQMAMQSLTKEQKDNLLANVWMQKKLAEVEVSEKAIRAR